MPRGLNWSISRILHVPFYPLSTEDSRWCFCFLVEVVKITFFVAVAALEQVETIIFCQEFRHLFIRNFGITL